MLPKLTKLNSQVITLAIISCSFLLCLIFFKIFTPAQSFAQCQPGNRNEGLISATQGVTSGTIFGNTGQVCITGTADASYREFKVPGYQDIEDQFYTFNRSSAKKTTPVPANLAFVGANSGNGIYLHTGNLTINASSGTGAQVIFIKKDASGNGDLNITGNITYADTASTSGLVFIVEGNINIDSSVTKVNAVLISSGIICTSYISGSGCSDGTAFTQPLVVNGSLISLNKAPVGGNAIRFVRNLEVNNQAAEVINKQPKYLYILRNGLFTRDLVITTEDQHYPVPTDSSYTPALSVNGRCAPNPASALIIPYAQTTWTFTGTIGGTGIYNYSWTGTDLSTSGTSPTTEKIYTSAGTKTASLIITDLGNPQTPPSQPITCSDFTAMSINFIDIDPTRDIGDAINNLIDLPGSPPDIGAAAPTFNFSLSNSGNIAVQQGNSGNNTITATLTSGTTASVALSASGLPAGTSASFSPTSCNPTCTSTLTITAGASTPTGNSTITVAGNSGSRSQNTTFTLTVTPPPHKRVFVTSQRWNGNLGGLTGADQKCQIAADSSSLGGTWRAWLSSGVTSVSSRLTHSTLPYRLLNSTVIANNWNGLTNGDIQNPINRTETGTTVASHVWTNTLADGSLKNTSTGTCNNWNSSSSGENGKTGGSSHIDARWTDNDTDSCNTLLPLYCFEQ